MLTPDHATLENADIPQDVLIAVAEGRKIEAIQLLRKHSGMGLRQARRLVDTLERSRGAPKPGDLPQFTEVGGSRGFAVIVIALLLAWVLYETLVGS
jgi:hypothetical protein